MKLQEYLDKFGKNYSQFAREIGVKPDTVRRYALGERIPEFDIMGHIIKATNGWVTPNDFYT